MNVNVFEADEVCDWLVRVPSGNPEPDFPSDLWREVECGAKLRTDGANGWACANGHYGGNLETRLAPFGEEWQNEQNDRDNQ